MATAVFNSPIKSFKGETKTLSTSAQVVAVEPGYHEVNVYCPSQWRLALAPRLNYVFYNTGTTYTDYTEYAVDKSSSTHVPLDAMPATDYLYMGFSGKTRGVKFDIGTNEQNEAAALDVEYGNGQQTTLTAAITAAATSCVVSSATGFPGTAFTAKIDNEDVTVSNVVGTTVTIGRAAGAVAHGIGAKFTCMFHDVADDSDGTNVVADTLQVDGNYTWTLPSVWIPSFNINGISSTYWIRFKPSATLDATTDIDEITPLAPVASYAYMEAGISYQFSINTEKVGALEVLATAGTPTLDISWIQH